MSLKTFAATDCNLASNLPGLDRARFAAWFRLAFNEMRARVEKYSQGDLAHDVGDQTRETISSWMNGKSTPRLRALKAICLALNKNESEALVALGLPDVSINALALRLVGLHRDKINQTSRDRWKRSPKCKIKPRDKKTPRRLRWEAFNKLTPEVKIEAQKITSTQHKHRRRALIAGSGGSHSRAEFYQLIKSWGHRCAYCGTKDAKLTADHIVALVRGGHNGIENIVPACASCNSSKSDRDLLLWSASKGLTIPLSLVTRYCSLRGAIDAN